MSIVYYALVNSSILYFILSRGAFLTLLKLVEILRSFLNRPVKYRLTESMYDFDGRLLNKDCINYLETSSKKSLFQ